MRQIAIWIDHHEARVFHVDGAAFDEKTVEAPNHHFHRHPKSREDASHPDDEHRFFEQVIAAVGTGEDLLILGPSVTKLHLLRYLQKKDPALAARVVGVESAAHLSDRQLFAHIRHYFHNDPPRIGAV